MSTDTHHIVGKADVAASRNERLSKKNPDRIRKQIDDLKAITEGGGKLTTHEQQVLEGLEKELRAVSKAREALGDKAPTFSRSGPSQHGYDRHDGHGRKRQRDEDESSTDGDVPDDVRSIPMPRDTPPPIPKKYLDEWYAKRRARRNANIEPLGDGRGGRRAEQGAEAVSQGVASSAAGAAHAAPAQAVQAKAVYEAKPVIRDLQKEAVTAFIPTAVRRKIDKSRGVGGLLEPEEADQLEREGYLRSSVRGGGGTGVQDGAGEGGSADDLARDSKKSSGQREASRGPRMAVAVRPGIRQATVEDVDDKDDEG